MSRSNVSHLAITPQAIIDDLLNKAHEIKEIYVVIIRHDNSPGVSAAGDLKGLGFAVSVMQDYWRRVFNE